MPLNDLPDFSKEPDIEISREEWNPTKEQMRDFLARDSELARANVRKILLAAKECLSLKDIKAVSLHSIETVEDALSMEVAAGRVLEEDYKFRLLK